MKTQKKKDDYSFLPKALRPIARKAFQLLGVEDREFLERANELDLFNEESRRRNIERTPEIAREIVEDGEMKDEYYAHWGSDWFEDFLKKNPEFNTEAFRRFVIQHNKADRDSGELHDIAHHEVLRLAAEYSEYVWRTPNVHEAYPKARNVNVIGLEDEEGEPPRSMVGQRPPTGWKMVNRVDDRVRIIDSNGREAKGEPKDGQ